MAVARPTWVSVSRILALISLILLIIATVVPGVPEWLLPLAVALLAIAILFYGVW